MIVPALPQSLRSWLPSVLMALMSGILLAESYSLHPFWWAAWVAPVPLLAASLSGPPGRGHRLGLLAGLVPGINALGYYGMVMPLPVALFLILLRAWFWGGAMGVAERAGRRLPPSLAVFALPLFAAGLETVVMAVSPHGAAGSLAYSQLAALPVLQIASLGGVPAVVFVVLTGGSMAGLGVARLMGAQFTGGIATAARASCGVVVLALGFGMLRLGSALPAGRNQDVALVVTDQFPGEVRSWAPLWAAYGPAVQQAARPGSVVVLPEKILRSTDPADAVAQLAATARSHQASIVAGIETLNGAGHWVNRAYLMTPDGTVRSYDKQRLVPGLEARDQPGQTDLLANLAGVHTGLAICKDMHFPDVARRYGTAGAGLMLVPAWDFDADGWLSDRLTVLRGVESGFSVARTARNGISSVSDRYGRILAEATSNDGVQIVRAAAPVGGGATLYARTGNIFGWAALAATLALIAVLRRRPRRGYIVRPAAAC